MRRVTNKEKESNVLEFVQPKGFQKGRKKTGGAVKGQSYKHAMTRKIAEAMINGTEACGADGEGEGGMNGYFETLARDFPDIHCRLLAQIIPQQINKNVTHEFQGADAGALYETREQVLKALADRGLPLPSKLIDVTPNKEPSKERKD